MNTFKRFMDAFVNNLSRDQSTSNSVSNQPIDHDVKEINKSNNTKFQNKKGDS